MIEGNVDEKTTIEVARQWFGSLEAGNFDNALKYVARDVLWQNIAPTRGVSDLAPWLGVYRGIDDVLESFKVWAGKSRMMSFKLLNLVVEGENAIGLVHEHAQCLANGNEYDLYVATWLTVREGKIAEWRVFWDPSPLIAAYRDIK